MARLPIQPGNSDLCFAYDGPIEGVIARLDATAYESTPADSLCRASSVQATWERGALRDITQRSGMLRAMTPEPVTWVREDHTAAKHELLVAFFNKWVSVHSEWYAGRGGGLVRIYDGFAGPGVYTGGEPGSPAILLRALARIRGSSNTGAQWITRCAS